MGHSSFADLFEQATGREPYDYQRVMGERARPPSVLEVPTGSGKTHALLTSWLYARLVREVGPRRLVYALPMRTLVEQTAEVARTVRARLGLSEEDLPIHVLMGGEAPTDWRMRPRTDQILVGTIDMLLSRALNRGYGESRFAWPVAFGLLNSDCRWVLDEVQLMGPARTTSAQLDGLRSALGTAALCETVWVSATIDREALRTVDRPGLGDVLRLSDADRAGPLGQRLNARKVVRRAPVGDAREMAARVREAHVPGDRTLVVLNTVQRAQDVHAALSTDGAERIVLLHSRFRPHDRAARTVEALAAPDPMHGTIVVATQVVEAGIDMSARVLATETAPFSAVVQRLGRCNRYAEHSEATVLWLDGGEPEPKMAPPYEVDDLRAARAALLELDGESASPERLGSLDVPERREPPLVLRRRDLLDLFDTAPDLSGLDVDVSGFIRDADRRSVSVFFREDLQADAPSPSRHELVDVPIGDLRSKRTAWVFDHVEGRWGLPLTGALRPGEVAMLEARAGGYDEQVGWQPRLRTPVSIVPPAATSPEGLSDDPLSVSGRWVELLEHLGAAAEEANVVAADAPHDRAIVRAAALHDVGKAHAAFQGMLRSSAPEEERPELDGRSYAKSPYSGGRHERPHFRHELASALALLAAGEDDLVTYLVAAHHGRVRLSIRPAPGEPGEVDGRRIALGVHDGDPLPAVATPEGELAATTLDLDPMELGAPRSWTGLAVGLRDRPDLGPFRLAYLEALVRVADWRASARA